MGKPTIHIIETEEELQEAAEQILSERANDKNDNDNEVIDDV